MTREASYRMRKYRSACTWQTMALCAAMFGSGGTSASEQTMNRTDFERSVTHCVGRFLIDLPADAEYVGGNYEYAFARVESRPMERDEFQKEVETIESELRNGKHKSGTSLLLSKATSGADMQVLGYWGNENRSSVVEISGYRWLQGRRYLVHKRATYDKLESASHEWVQRSPCFKRGVRARQRRGVFALSMRYSLMKA